MYWVKTILDILAAVLPAVISFFTGRLKLENEKLQQQGEADEKVINASNDVDSDSAVRDRLRAGASDANAK